jgi:hypothetical protein
MFYQYNQNNSGGSFTINEAKGIGPVVWIEANSGWEADKIAESKGIYFDGVEQGWDCDCCGDRWIRNSSAWNGAKSTVEIDYSYNFWEHDTVYVHRMDGTIESIK